MVLKIILAVIAIIILCGKDAAIDLSGKFNAGLVGGIIAIALMVALILKFALSGKNDNKEVEGE